MWCVVYPDELYHHGIKGQKWGIRRFQNPDGSLTAAGRKRYNVYDDGSYARKSGRTRSLEKSVAYARADEEAVRSYGKDFKGRDDAIRETRAYREAQESALAESRERDRRSTGNGKKIAVAVGATVAAAVATGLAIKYRNEISAIVRDHRKTSLDDFIKAGEKAQKTGDSLRAAGGRVKASVGKTLSSAFEKAVTESTNALLAAPVTVAAGYGLKKISDTTTRAEQEKGKNYFRDVAAEFGNRSLKSLESGFGPGGNKNGSSGNKTGSGKGIDLNAGDNQQRYNEILSRFPKDSEERAQIKKKRKEVSTIAELESYADGL